MTLFSQVTWFLTGGDVVCPLDICQDVHGALECIDEKHCAEVALKWECRKMCTLLGELLTRRACWVFILFLSLCWGLCAYYPSGSHYPLRAECDEIFSNLLMFQPFSRNNNGAAAFLREFFQTERCDSVHNMSTFRDKYTALLQNSKDEKEEESTRLQRILGGNASKQDTSHLIFAIIHYHNWHRQQLISGLSWRAWVRTDSALTIFTVCSAVVAWIFVLWKCILHINTSSAGQVRGAEHMA